MDQQLLCIVVILTYVVNYHQPCLGKLVSVYQFVASIIRICVEKCLSSALLKVEVYIYVLIFTLWS